MASTTVTIQHTEDIKGINSGARKEGVRALINALEAYSSGAKRCGPIDIIANNSEDLVAASGTVTCASVSAADTVTINGVVFTASSNPGAGEFEIDGDDTADAAALAACINASTNALITGIVTATSALGVVTVTANQKGRVGNCITLASSNGTRLAVSGARLTSGTGGKGTAVTYTF